MNVAIMGKHYYSLFLLVLMNYGEIEKKNFSNVIVHLLHVDICVNDIDRINNIQNQG